MKKKARGGVVSRLPRHRMRVKLGVRRFELADGG